MLHATFIYIIFESITVRKRAVSRTLKVCSLDICSCVRMYVDLHFFFPPPIEVRALYT